MKYSPRYYDLLRSTRPDTEVSKIIGVTTRTVNTWRKTKVAVRGTIQQRHSVDYGPVDSMLQQGVPIREIAKRVKCNKSTVAARARKIGIRRQAQAAKDGEVAPFINPQDRFREAIAMKAETLNLPDWYPIEKWLVGVAGREFMAAGGY